MRICLIGCVEFSERALRKLLALESQGVCEICGVITKSKSHFNADFVDIGKVFIGSGKADRSLHYYIDELNALSFIEKIKPDVIYCFGWSSLLSKCLLDSVPKGVIGFHPAELPYNRGRHPIIWALALGLEETASTFFRMDEGADSGPILSQKKISISKKDNARTLYDKVVEEAVCQIDDFTKDLAVNAATFEKQDHNVANYWRKRSAKDGVIDWRMHAENIYNLVRALSFPYPGAEIYSKERGTIKVWSSTIERASFSVNLEPGKILGKERNRLLVKCGGETALWLEDVEPMIEQSVGDYL